MLFTHHLKPLALLSVTLIIWAFFRCSFFEVFVSLCFCCPPQTDTWHVYVLQWDYNNWIADQCGVPSIEEWRRQMYIATSKNRVLRPESYRDEWDDDDLVLQAQQDFANYLTWCLWQVCLKPCKSCALLPDSLLRIMIINQLRTIEE